MTRRIFRGSFELYSWLFMRVSGIALAVLVVIHLIYLHFFIGVDKIDFSVVASRWTSPGWRIFDLVMLLLALTHGGNGVRIVLEDYLRRRSWRIAAFAVLGIVWAALLVIGSHVVLTFDPSSLQEAGIVS